MASIKVKFRPSAAAEGEGTVYYQIIHDRKVRQLVTNYRVRRSEWDECRATVVCGQESERRGQVMAIRERIRRDMERLRKTDERLANKGREYTAEDVIAEFGKSASEGSLSNFMEGLIARMIQNGRIRTAETYRSALNSFRRFLANRQVREEGQRGDDVMLCGITAGMMEDFEAWQKLRGNSQNTVSFYTRILRAAYNRAVEEEIIENRNPFRHVYTGVDKTAKRALPLQMIKKIKRLDLAPGSPLDFARDMFIMSFMLRGMSFVDMAYLRKSDLANGHVTYRRRKTGQQLTIEWTKEMQKILSKYPENRSEYLLPIIRNKGVNERCAYRNVGYNINHNLKTMAKMAGLDFRLTMYVARHSWASAAKAKGIPVSVISEGMGHDSETTTQIYLASLDTTVVDRANSIILKELL